MILVVILCLVFIESVHDCDIFVLKNSSFSVVFSFPVKLFFRSSFEGNLPCVLFFSFVRRKCNEIRFLVLLHVTIV